jgi:hypothetical protein
MNSGNQKLLLWALIKGLYVFIKKEKWQWDKAVNEV